MKNKISNFRKDLDRLLCDGDMLSNAIQKECYPKEYEVALLEKFGDGADEFDSSVPSFKKDYQKWYSESLALLRQLLPDRVSDFCRFYEKPKSRRTLTRDTYSIEDYFQGDVITRGAGIYKERVVGPEQAIPLFLQQLAILRSVESRFESSLFDIRKMMQADLLDTEIEAAEHLAKWSFFRASGAVAGVVLERHLGVVCMDHGIKIAKKNPTISDFNEALKLGEIIDIPQWRFIQHLADIRNVCDHAKNIEPTGDQVLDLLAGTKKVLKTVF